MITQTLSPSEEKYRTFQGKRTREAGFPLSALNYPEEQLNLNDHLVKRPASTFFSRVRGNASENLGLYDGDLLVVDRSLAPRHNCLVIAELNGELKVCRLIEYRGEWYAEMGDRRKVTVKDDGNQQFYIWGRVTHVIHSCI